MVIPQSHHGRIFLELMISPSQKIVAVLHFLAMSHVRITFQSSLVEEDNFSKIFDVNIRKHIGSTLLPMSESVRLFFELALRESVPQVTLHIHMTLFEDFQLALLEGVARLRDVAQT